jgi:magnesium-transporting ATPase (P-type)
MKITREKLIQTALTAGAAVFTTVSPILATESVEITRPNEGISNFGSLISAGIRLALLIAALLTFVFLIWGGIQWITSGGDKSAYESARNRITAALVGLAIVAASWAIMTIIEKFFNISILGGFEIPTPADYQ